MQTVKRCLRRPCEEKLNVDTWDEQLAYISLGYNCSKQSSTGYAPYKLLYARDPFVPSAVSTRMAPPLDFDSEATQERTAAELLRRAGYLAQAMPTVASNLAIAQHRDTLRYAMTRSGAYTPQLRKISKGDYVYLRRSKMESTLQIEARQTILRVLEVRQNGSLLLQGRCGCTIVNNIVNVAPCHLPDIDGVIHPELARPHKQYACEVCNMPDDEGLMLLCDACGAAYHTYCLTPPMTRMPKSEEDWICPCCSSAGITVHQVRTTRAGRVVDSRPNTDRLFSDANARARVAKGKSYDGRLVLKKGKNSSSKPAWGIAAFRGAEVKPEASATQRTTYCRATVDQPGSSAACSRELLPAGH